MNCAGIPLVAVNNNVLLAGRPAHHPPLGGRGVTGAAATAEAALLDRLDHLRRPARLQTLAQRREALAVAILLKAVGLELAAVLGDDPHLRHTVVLHQRGVGRRLIVGVGSGKLLVSRFRHRGQVVDAHRALHPLVYLHRGRQRAAAKAAHRLDRRVAIGVGVVTGRDAEFPPQLVEQSIRPRHVTRSPATHLQDVLTARPLAELGIERRNAGDLVALDFGQLRQPRQRQRRQVVVVLVDGVQQRDQAVLLPAVLLDQPIQGRQVNRGRLSGGRGAGATASSTAGIG